MVLTANCSQKLEIQDFSYCLQIPLAYVPRYLGEVDSEVKQGVTLFDDAKNPEMIGMSFTKFKKFRAEAI